MPTPRRIPDLSQASRENLLAAMRRAAAACDAAAVEALANELRHRDQVALAADDVVRNTCDRIGAALLREADYMTSRLDTVDGADADYTNGQISAVRTIAHRLRSGHYLDRGE